MIKDVISKFKASLKGKPRLWFEMQYPTVDDEPKTVQGYRQMLSAFTTEHNPIGSTKEQQIMAWKNLKWDPSKEKLDDFVYRFRRVAKELGYNADENLEVFSCCVPSHLYLYLKGATSIKEAMENIKRACALGGVSAQGPTMIETQAAPVVPFIHMNDRHNLKTVSFKNEVAHIAPDKNDIMIDMLAKISEKLNTSDNRSRGRNRERRDSRDRRPRSYDRSPSYDRSSSYDRSQSRERSNSRDRGRDRSRDRGDRSKGRNQSSRERRNNSGTRYGSGLYCEHCKMTNHDITHCFKLQKTLKKKGIEWSEMNKKVKDDQELYQKFMKFLETNWINKLKQDSLCAKGNPKFSCPPILSHSDDECLGSESDSREELFDSSLDTVNVSVNTEFPKNSSHGSEEEEFDFLHLYEELSDYDFHRMMSVDDFTYSTAFSNEVFDNGEWYTYAGLETCNIMKSARHGKELLSKSIQSTTQGDSGIDNLTCLSGDDTKLGTDHTKADVYESSNNMSESKSINENQSESDSDLEDDFFSVPEEIEIFLESDDGEYFSAEESLEGTLDASFKSIPCTVVSYQDNLGLNDLDPSTVVRSSEVPGPSDKWEDVDLSSLCIFNELPLEPCDNEVMFSRPIGFDGSSTDAIDYAKDFLRRQSTLENLLSAKSPEDCDDANSIWSILTDKLLYCQSDTSDSVRHFSYDSLKAESAKQILQCSLKQ